MKNALILAFLGAAVSLWIELSHASPNLTGSVAINPATGQEIARVVAMNGGGGIKLDTKVTTRTIVLVPPADWLNGKCGACHGR